MELINEVIGNEETREIFEQRKSEFVNYEFLAKKGNEQFKRYRDLFDHPFDVDNLEFFKLAVLLSYNDTKRTLNGIGKAWKDNDTKDSFFKFIAEELQKIFKQSPANFDNAHDKLCQNLRDHSIFKNLNVIFTYGHAQKIVNMAFKYIFCMRDTDEYRGIFEQCHMPLDSYTLTWYKRSSFYENLNRTNTEHTNAILRHDDTWSKMSEEQYKSISRLIKKSLERQEFYVYDKSILLPNQPLYAEFIIWPEMQLHIASEKFFSSLSSNLLSEKIDLNKEKLEIKLQKINTLIDIYTRMYK